MMKIDGDKVTPKEFAQMVARSYLNTINIEKEIKTYFDKEPTVREKNLIKKQWHKLILRLHNYL